MVLNAAVELSEINNLPFQVHPSLCTLPYERAEPIETGREQIQTDRHAWREEEGDKEEINTGSGDEGCVHRCCEEM